MKQQRWTGIFTAICMLILILDAPTALSGARSGLELSINTVIPALFPFIITSTMLNSVMIGKRIPILRGVGRLCGIPAGAESLLVIGLIGGYPVGAKMITDAYEAGQLDKHTARRLLGFCNNAGPAFIFGMIGQMFSGLLIPFILWLIHIFSALIVGIILPQKSRMTCRIPSSKGIRLHQALENSIRTVAIICGWIVLWRIFIAICEKWFLFRMPVHLQVIFTGLCELSNGCIALKFIEEESIRFVIASCLLACGGFCVAMQTNSVTKGLGTGVYLRGKALQLVISFILSASSSCILYPSARKDIFVIPLLITMPLMISYILITQLKQKKVVAFR